MLDKTQYLTREGMQALEERLEEFIQVKRPEVAERLKRALEDGGELTENTEYEDAKNEQAFIEAEITRMTLILRNAQLIDEKKLTNDRVQIGSRVVIVEAGTKEQEEYQVVGSAEANPLVGKISDESPLGKALLGKKVGEKVTVHAPAGDSVFTIKKIF
ncbi:transcription elongation factor GreA [Aggregatilineales bacterium SYSU G02658]